MITTKAAINGRIDGLNIYLRAGYGRGRSASKATVYDGRVGYFFIRTEIIGGQGVERIMFATFDEGDIIVSEYSIFAPNRYPEDRIRDHSPILIDYNSKGPYVKAD